MARDLKLNVSQTQVTQPVKRLFLGIGYYYAIYSLAGKEIAIDLMRQKGIIAANIKGTNVWQEWSFTRQAQAKALEPETKLRGKPQGEPQFTDGIYVIPDVPLYDMSEVSRYFPNVTNNCGPTAGSMVLGYYRNVVGRTNIDQWKVGDPPTFPLHEALYSAMKTNQNPWPIPNGTWVGRAQAGLEAYASSKGYNFAAPDMQAFLNYGTVQSYMNANRPGMILYTMYELWGSPDPSEDWHWVTLKGWKVINGTAYVVVNNPWNREDNDAWDSIKWASVLVLVKENPWKTLISGRQALNSAGEASVIIKVESLKDENGNSVGGNLEAAEVDMLFAENVNNINVSPKGIGQIGRSLTNWTSLINGHPGYVGVSATRVGPGGYTIGPNPAFPYDLISFTPTLTGAASGPPSGTNSEIKVYVGDLQYEVYGNKYHATDESPVVYNFLRGDANGNGSVTITDALYIAQYLAGLRALGEGSLQVRPVNAASPRHDQGYGDLITIQDALFIAQYLAGLRDNYYRFAPVEVQVGSKADLVLNNTAQIPITVKNIQDANGLGSYELNIAFNKDVIRVDSITGGTSPFGSVTSSFDNTKGTITLNAQQSSQNPGPKDEIVVAYLNITGIATGTTTLDVTTKTISSFRGDSLMPTTDTDGSVTVIQ